MGEGYSQALEQLFEEKEESIGSQLEDVFYLVEYFECSCDVLVLGWGVPIWWWAPSFCCISAGARCLLVKRAFVIDSSLSVGI